MRRIELKRARNSGKSCSGLGVGTTNRARALPHLTWFRTCSPLVVNGQRALIPGYIIAIPFPLLVSVLHVLFFSFFFLPYSLQFVRACLRLMSKTFLLTRLFTHSLTHLHSHTRPLSPCRRSSTITPILSLPSFLPSPLLFAPLPSFLFSFLPLHLPLLTNKRRHSPLPPVQSATKLLHITPHTTCISRPRQPEEDSPSSCRKETRVFYSCVASCPSVVMVVLLFLKR